MKKLFGKRLRELRLKKCLTQEQVAELINIKPENYSRLENGLSFPKPENIEKIAKILGVEISELFQFEHLDDIEKIKAQIFNSLNANPDTVRLTYKFIKSIGLL